MINGHKRFNDILIHSLYYYKGNTTNTLINQLSDKYGMIFCESNKFVSSVDNDHEYYDPVRRRYVSTEKNTRKNIMLKYYYYDTCSEQFIKIDINDNKRYSKKFFSDNFIKAIKIEDKIHLLSRMKKIEKIKRGLK